jgi:hypothetical protein
MGLLSCEQRARSVGGCAVFLLLLVLAGAFTLATIAMYLQSDWSVVVAGPIAAFMVFLCFSYIFGFVKNEVWRFGIRDDTIWWDSPRWPRSAGAIPLDDVCKVTVYEGGGKLEVTMWDGTTRRISCCAAAGKLRAILSEHYPCVAIEFIESRSD